MPDLDLVKLEECAQRDAQHSESLTAIAPQVVLLLIQRCRAAERHAAAAQPRIRDLEARIAELESAARAISSGRDDLDALEKRFTGVVPPAERETQAIVMPLIALVRSLDAELARHGDEAVTLRRERDEAVRQASALTEDRDLLAAIDAAHAGNRPLFSEMALALKREERERAAAVQIAEEARRKRDEARAALAVYGRHINCASERVFSSPTGQPVPFNELRAAACDCGLSDAETSLNVNGDG